MKLIYKIISRLSIALLVLMAGWSVAFYFILIDEINDETDDALENYAHYIITRALAGEKLPSNDNGTNNTYYLTEVDAEYAAGNPVVSYTDEAVYIWSRMETEPARVLKTIFRDSHDRYYELTVAIPSYEKADLKSRILWWILILYIILLVTVLAVNMWIIRRSFRPLYVLLDWIGSFKLGEEVPLLDNETDITEFRKLNEAMLRTADRNNRMFEEQRLFIGNASHELQTPVAVCRTRLEMLADSASLCEAELEQIGSVLRTLDQLSKLNKTLLLLSRIENNQFTDCTDVEVNPIVSKLTDDYREVYSYRNVSAELTESNSLTVCADESLVSVLVNNLLKNAFVHTPEGGMVYIIVDADTFSVSNTASGGPLDPTVIYRRFYRGEKKEGSAGLGLSLVESICRLYGFSIVYSFCGALHTFTVAFRR